MTSAILRRVLLGAFVVGLGFSITLSESALALLTLLWLWRLRDPAVRRVQAWPLWAPVLAFSTLSLVSALASGHALSSIAASKGLLLAAALFVTVDGLDDISAADGLLSGIAVAAAGAAVIGLIQVSACPGTEPGSRLAAWFFRRCDRARGFFSIYMTLAGVLSVPLLAVLPRLLPGGGWRWRWLLTWVVSLVGLVLTYTRGAWIGFGAGVAVLVPMSRRGRFFLVGGLAVLVAIMVFGPHEVSYRVRSIGDPDEAGIKERRYMWTSGFAMWRERPLLGWGPGGVKREYERYARPEASKKRTGHVHNTPLQILVERGVLGLTAWLAIWVTFCACAIGLLRQLDAERIRERALVAGSLAAVTGFLVAGLSEYNFGDSEVVMLVWTVMALPYVVVRQTESVVPTHLPERSRIVFPSETDQAISRQP